MFSCGVNAQNIKIGETGTPAHQDAILELESNSKGFLMPRLTTAQRNAMASPPPGMQIYNIDTDCIEIFFASGGWNFVKCGCTSFPDATFANPGGAANVPVSFVANTIVGTNSYSWTFDQGSPSSSSSSSENVTWTTAGTYPVTLTVTDDDNCTASTTENVEIIPCASFPDATFIWSNGSINSPIAFSANGSGPGYTYAWTFPSGTPSTSSLQTPTVEWAAAGTYTVELTVTDNLGCSATETMAVTISLCTPETWSFTNCGQTGNQGPTQAQCNSAYSATNLNGQVTLSGGIQQWTVPSTGTYHITVAGGEGGTSNGGAGALIIGDFNFTGGDQLKILVGQRGAGDAGGGGSYVTTNTNVPLIIAGGGGAGTASWAQSVGSASNNGNSGAQGGTPLNNGGTGGNGGGGTASSTTPSAGGGLLTDGAGNFPGRAFVNGGIGGISGANIGGFGGGGGRRGGGGGYSGGGAGGWGSGVRTGGGGGSFNAGTNQNNTAGANTGHGYVTIEKICP